LAEDRDEWRTLLNTPVELPVPSKEGNLYTVDFSRRTVLHALRYDT
jgi:hypothetical protein